MGTNSFPGGSPDLGKGHCGNLFRSRTSEGQVPPAVGTFIEPWGIAIDMDGNILVADTWNHRIQKSDSEGKFLLQWGVSGLAGDGLDRLWGPRSLAVAPDGKFLSSFPVQGWNCSSIENKPNLAVNQGGQVFVTDPEGFRVLIFSPDGKPLFVFGTYGTEEYAFGLPNGIAISPGHTVWVADSGNNRLERFPKIQP